MSAAFFFDRCSRGIAIPTLLHPPVVLGRVPRIVGIREPACAPGVLTKRSRFWIDYMCTSLVSVAGKFRDL